MKTIGTNKSSFTLVAAALFACACLLFPSLLAAQSEPIDTCSSGVVDSWEGVEQTVCLYGDLTSVEASGEVDNYVFPDDPDMYASTVGLELELVNMNTQDLEWDSGDQQNASSQEIDEYHDFTPIVGTTYYLDSYYDEYICQWNDNDCYYDGWWSDGAQGLEAEATVTSGLPTPPPNATVFSNLQTIQDWKLCEGECVINGTNTGPPNDNGHIYYGISSPSLSGASMEQED